MGAEYLNMPSRDCDESILDGPQSGCAGSRSIEYDQAIGIELVT